MSSTLTALVQHSYRANGRGGDRRTVELRELDLSSVPYVPLPSAPLPCQERDLEQESIPPPADWFEVSEGNWRIESVEKLAPGERPDPAFRRLCPTRSGTFFIDDLGNAKGFVLAKAAALRYDRSGRLAARAGFAHDIYRLGVHPLGHGLIAMSKECVVHAYDDDLHLILETSLPASPEMQALRRRFEILDFQLKNHIRSVALSPDQSRYLITSIDEAWCFDVNGQPIWRVKLPGREGWRRIEDYQGARTSAEVQDALKLMNLARLVTAEQLKQRYRQLAMLWHPDRHDGDPAAHARMTALNSAVEVLAAMDSSGKTARFVREQDHFEIEVGGERLTLDFCLGSGTLFACDWIYAAGFAAYSNCVYLGGYSGRVIVLDENGQPISGYETGTPPDRIVEVGEYLYILTGTRLYVIRGDSLLAMIPTRGIRELMVTQNGFGLLESKRLKWFGKDGHQIAAVLSKEPLRSLYNSDAGLVLETRQRRAVFSGAAPWWE